MMTRQATQCGVLLLVIVFFASVDAWGDHGASRVMQSFSFKPPFFPEAGTAAVPGWEVRGAAAVFPEFIRLTPAEQGRSGYISNRRPFFLKTLELNVEFRVHSNTNQGADGMAIWLTDQPIRPGTVFGAADKWNGLAILFDTYDNDGKGTHPMISAHMNTGNKEFSFESDGEHTLINSCSINYRNTIKNTIHLYIEHNVLNIFVNTGDGDWKHCLTAPIEMPQRYFFSVSAATGGLYDNHDIYSFMVNTMDEKLSVTHDDINKPPNTLVDTVLSKEEPEKPSPLGLLGLNKNIQNREQLLEDRQARINQINSKPEPEPEPIGDEEKAAPSQEQIDQENEEIKRQKLQKLQDELTMYKEKAEKNEEAARIAEELLRIRQIEDRQREEDWKQKQVQLNEAQFLAQKLLEEQEKEKNREFAQQFANCEVIKTECTNLAALYRKLKHLQTEMEETFGHELAEIAFLLNSEFDSMEEHLRNAANTAGAISNDLRQTQYLVPQYIDIAKRIDTATTGNERNNDESELHGLSILADQLFTSFRDLKREQNRISSSVDIIKRNVKTGGSQIWGILIVGVIGIQFAIYVAKTYLRSRRGARRRGELLY